MSVKSDERLAEVAKWFIYHKGTIPPDNLGKRLEFLEKMCHNLLDVCIMQAEDIKELEGVRRKILMPSSVVLKENGVVLR